MNQTLSSTTILDDRFGSAGGRRPTSLSMLVRTFRAVALGAVVVVPLVGCGSSDEAATAPAALAASTGTETATGPSDGDVGSTEAGALGRASTAVAEAADEAAHPAQAPDDSPVQPAPGQSGPADLPAEGGPPPDEPPLPAPDGDGVEATPVESVEPGADDLDGGEVASADAPVFSTFEVTAVEGTNDVMLNMFVTDPQNDQTVAFVDWGDGSEPQEFGLAGRVETSRAYPDGGLVNVSAVAHDAEGNESVTTAITSIAAPMPPVKNDPELVDWSSCVDAAGGPEIRFFAAATYSAYGTSQWVVDEGDAPLSHAEIVWNDGVVVPVDPAAGTLDHQYDRLRVTQSGGAVLRVRDAEGRCAGRSSVFTRPIVPIYDVTFHGVWIEATDVETCRTKNIVAGVSVFDQAGQRLNRSSTSADLLDGWHFFGGPQRVRMPGSAANMYDQRLDWTGPRPSGPAANIGPVAVVATLYVDGVSTAVSPERVTTRVGGRQEWRSSLQSGDCVYELVVVTESRLHTIDDA